MDTSAHVPQLDHLGFENLKRYLKRCPHTFYLAWLSLSLMLPKIPPGHSPEIVMLLVLLLNWKSMSKTSLGTFWGFRSPNGLREMCWGVCLGLAQKEISTRYPSSNLLRLISSTALQHDLTPRIYVLHKIMIALKFMSHINQKLPPSYQTALNLCLT